MAGNLSYTVMILDLHKSSSYGLKINLTKEEFE